MEGTQGRKAGTPVCGRKAFRENGTPQDNVENIVTVGSPRPKLHAEAVTIYTLQTAQYLS